MSMMICFKFMVNSYMLGSIQWWLHVLHFEGSGLAGLFALVFCFVLFCFAWPFMLVRKARCLFSGRVFSYIVYCLLCLMYFEFRCSICGIVRVTQLYDSVFSQVLFVLCC